MAETNKQLLTSEDIQNLLKELNIEYTCHNHKDVFNMDEMKKEVPLKNAPFLKNLFYLDKKNNFYFVVSVDDTKIEKSFWKNFGLAPGNLRLGREDHLKDILKGEKGSISPFLLKNDTENKVAKLIIDQNLFNYEYVAFHPNSHSQTLEFKIVDFEKFLEHINRKFDKCNLSEVVEVSQDKKQTLQKKGGNKPQKKKNQKEENQILKEEEEKINTLKIEYPKESKTFSKYYQQLITKSEVLDYYNISGCYILRPWGYSIWEKIQSYIDVKFKELDISNAYFPMFVSEANLLKEKDHLEGFSPEVAWISKTGDTELQNKIAIRPTSETIMYPAFANWIKSHRDLPLKLNQWSNVVRWEFKHPTPFIRTREFLWQEGHTAHETDQEAEEMVLQALEVYRSVYEDLLAIPVIEGVKSEEERFPGADKTYSVETCIPINGRAVQGATSHHLGQNFSKMFEIDFQTKKGSSQLVYQTSFGMTTRTIGVMLMYHSDNKGLILPPKVAKYQVVIVPIPFKNSTDNEKINQQCLQIQTALKKIGIRVFYDDCDNYNPGWKYNHWELKGVPIRIEIGPKDVANNQARIIKRNDGKKFNMNMENIDGQISDLLTQIQAELFEKAKTDFKSSQITANTWEEFMKALNLGKIIETPWCGNSNCEEEVKKKSKVESIESEDEAETAMAGSAKTLCIPLKQEKISEEAVCFHCKQKAVAFVWWGRSY